METTKATLVTDKITPGAYRVEYINNDGGVEVAMFSGPNALTNAANFGANTYTDLEDPEGLLR